MRRVRIVRNEVWEAGSRTELGIVTAPDRMDGHLHERNERRRLDVETCEDDARARSGRRHSVVGLAIASLSQINLAGSSCSVTYEGASPLRRSVLADFLKKSGGKRARARFLSVSSVLPAASFQPAKYVHKT